MTQPKLIKAEVPVKKLYKKISAYAHKKILFSNDIIKAHGGEIKVETKEGDGSEFMIQLPQQFNT